MVGWNGGLFRKQNGDASRFYHLLSIPHREFGNNHAGEQPIGSPRLDYLRSVNRF